MPSAHAKWFGASSSKKWLTCPASIQREEGLPNKSSNDAMWGTACHHISELALKNGEALENFLGRTFVAFDDQEDFAEMFVAGQVFDMQVEIDQEMIDTAKVYTDFVQHLVETTGGELFVEQRLD